jgi:class 3 adenylate cyclase/pimeloyl-ACP methyl ester carboxylesterase
MLRPETRFVGVGRERVAYQVFGDGAIDFLFLKAFLASVDAVWEHPGHLRWSRTLATHLRVVMLDHRGAGMSDAIDESKLGDLDSQVDDALAVLDELEIDRVCVCGEADGASTAVKLAVEHPERVSRLVLVNAAPTGLGFGSSAAVLDALADLIRVQWGTGEILAGEVPHFAGDPGFCARFERMGARPSAAAAFLRHLASLDIRPLLGELGVPTLVVHSGDFTSVTVGDARDLAARIPDARWFEGVSSTFYWGGGVWDEVIGFVSSGSNATVRDLVTILFTDVVDSTRTVVAVGDDEWRRTLTFLNDLVASRVAGFGGRVVKETGDGHLIEFARPGDAVRAAVAISLSAPALGVEIRAGIHTGEIERRENNDIGGLSVHIAARVVAHAGAGEIVVTRTVAELLGATEYQLHDRGEHELRGVPGNWRLFAISPQRKNSGDS